jgi:hypothetical protein
MAHAAIDNKPLFLGLFQKAQMSISKFQNWEITVLLWAQARLHLMAKLPHARVLNDVHSKSNNGGSTTATSSSSKIYADFT